MGTSSSKAGHGIEVGTIYVSMWGYEQTNVDYYEVTRATATTVTLVKIGKRRVGGSAYMVDEVEPKPGDHHGEPFRRKVTSTGGHVSIDSVAIARPWAGKPNTQTTYA